MTKRNLLRIAAPLTLVSVAAVLGHSFPGNDLDLQWRTVDGGGGVLAGGDYQLVGTVGQPDTAVLSSLAADLNDDCVVNALDLTRLLICFNQPADECPHRCDVNGDGQCNAEDLTVLLIEFGDFCTKMTGGFWPATAGPAP